MYIYIYKARVGVGLGVERSDQRQGHSSKVSGNESLTKKRAQFEMDRVCSSIAALSSKRW